MRSLRVLAASVIGILALGAEGPAAAASKMDFEGYSIKDQRCGQRAAVPFKCLELPKTTRNNRTWRYSFTKDPDSNHSVEIQTDPVKGKVLMLGMAPYDDGCLRRTPACSHHRKDKIEFWPVHPENDDAMDITTDEQKFFSFEFKLDAGYEVGNRMVLHMQARQELPGNSPIFTMYVQPEKRKDVNPATAPVDLVFVVRDDEDVRRHGRGSDDNEDDGNADAPFFRFGRAIRTLRIERDRWYRMTLQLRPAYIGSGREGHIVMWLDGEQKFEYNGTWGYKPDPKVPRSKKIGLAFDIYRGPFQQATQKIYFDNVNYSSSLDDVKVNGH